MKKRIVFLMSDTGGGHRAAAEAITDALIEKYGDEQVDSQLVDVFRNYTYPPFRSAPESYPVMVNKSPILWKTLYEIPNSPRRALIAKNALWYWNRRKLMQLPKHYPADVVVSVHSVITRPSFWAYQQQPERPPFLTVVTDLTSTPMLWYEKRCEHCYVPTQRAYDRGLACGMRPEQITITGLPVNPSFIRALGSVSKQEARTELGWDPNLPTIMMVAGGEGMGPIFETARSIDAQNLHCQLVVIAGKNATLKDKLEGQAWNQPTHIYGFVNMPLFMLASDILVTKAGPGTITEAGIASLPMIIMDRIPGQEEGNVDHVVDNGAGVYAPKPGLVAEEVTRWLERGQTYLEERASNAKKLANPDAVYQIAENIWEYAHFEAIVGQT